MKNLHHLSISIAIIGSIFLLSCETSEETSEGEKIIKKSIESSGGENYAQAEIKFNFRNKEYRSLRNGEMFQLERIVKDSTGNITKDVLSNDGLERYVNGTLVKLPDSIKNTISAQVNSVHYFVQLPYVLRSPAVIEELVGEDEVEGETYFEVKVSFREAGGGADFHDKYMYWIHKEDYTVDYFAYRFFTNDGGIRFRKAVNPRRKEGIRFVDYKNYKTDELSTPLHTLDSLYEGGALEFVSNIKNEELKVSLKKSN